MKTKDILFFGIMTILALIAGTYGMIRIGSPFAQAERKIDSTRVVNLSKFKYPIEEYVRKNGKLPTTLADIPLPTYTDLEFSKTDPQTKQPYGYKILDEKNYEVCATFTTDTMTSQNIPDLKEYSYNSISSEYKHPKGYYCFKQTVADYAFPTPTYTPYPTGPLPTRAFTPSTSVPTTHLLLN